MKGSGGGGTCDEDAAQLLEGETPLRRDLSQLQRWDFLQQQPVRTVNGLAHLQPNRDGNKFQD